MNTISRIALRINNKLLNKIDESNVTENDVDLAITSGYKYVSGESPIYLLKFPKILDLVLKEKQISDKEFSYLISHNYFKTVDELHDFFLRSDFNTKEVINHSNLTIEFIKKHIHEHSINLKEMCKREELIYDFLEAHPRYIDTINYQFQNYDKLYQILKKNNIEFDEIENYILDKEKLLLIWMKDDPKVLLGKSPCYIISNSKATIISYVMDCLNNKTLSFEEVINAPIGYRTQIIENILNDDFSKIELLKDEEAIHVIGSTKEDILTIFLNKLPESINYLNTVSKIFEMYDYRQKVQEIKDQIINLELTVGPCNWYTIFNDKTLMMKSIIANPSILPDLDKEMFNEEILTEDEINKIISLIRENHIAFYKCTPLMYNYHQIFIEALKTNPYIIDSLDIYKADIDDTIINILIEKKYQISEATPYAVFNNHANFIISQLETNIDIINHQHFYLNVDDKEKTLRVYNIIISSGINLTPEIIERLNNPLIYIEALKKGIITPKEVIYKYRLPNNYYYNSLITYILNNYPENEIPEEIQKTGIYKKNKNIGVLAQHRIKRHSEELENEIIFKIKEDFSYCKKINEVNLSPETLKEIADIYIANREEYFKYYETTDFIGNNTYICFYEKLYYGTPIQNKNIQITLNSSLADSIIYILRKSDKKEIKDYSLAPLVYRKLEGINDILEKYPKLLDYCEDDQYSDLIIDMFVQGKYTPSIDAKKFVYRTLLQPIIENDINFDYEEEFIENGFKIINSDFLHNYTALFYKALKKGKYTLAADNNKKINTLVNALTPEQLRTIITEYPENVVILNSNNLSPELQTLRNDSKIATLISQIDEINKSRNEQKRVKKIELIRKKPKETNYLNSIKKSSMDDETYKYYHYSLFEEVKAKTIDYKTITPELLIYKDKDETTLDVEVIDYIAKNEQIFSDEFAYKIFKNKQATDLLSKYKDKISHEFLIIILETIQSISISTLRNLLDDISDKEALKILAENENLSDEVITFLLNNKKIVLDNNSFKKIYIKNKRFIIKLLEKDINNYQYIPTNETPNEDSKQKVYELFKNAGLTNPYVHPIFSKCSLIMKEFGQKTSEINEKLLEAFRKHTYNEEDILRITGYRDIISFVKAVYNIKPSFLKYIVRILDQDEIINFLSDKELKYSKEIEILLLRRPDLLRKVLKNDFANTINGIQNEIFNTIKIDEIVEMCINNKYTLTESSPKELKNNKIIALNSIKLDPTSVIYCNREIEFDNSEKALIQDIFIKNNIRYYDTIFPFLLNDIPYLRREIEIDPTTINRIPPSYFDFKTEATLIKIIKEKIKNKTYHFSLATPEWLLIDRELLMMAYQECPELIDKYPNIQFTLPEMETMFKNDIKVKNNPYEFLKEVINNYQHVDDYTFLENVSYPKELLNKLIDILIDNNYIVTERTSPILMSDKMIYYALKNNMNIDKSYIMKFISFENLYITKDIELFKKYINEGYSSCFAPYIKEWGLDKTLDIISKFGALISGFPPHNTPDINSIIKELISSNSANTRLSKIIVRGECELSDDEIKNGIKTSYYSTWKISDNKEIFQYLLRKKPERIKLYTGDDKTVFEEAKRQGYHYTIKEYVKTDNFRNSDYITELLLQEEPAIIECYKGANPTIFENALEKGYNVTKEKLAEVESFKQNPIMVRAAMQSDIESIYLYQGTASKEFRDLFEMTDSQGKRIIPTPEVIKRLNFIHDDKVLMMKAIEYDINNIIYYTGILDEEIEDKIINGVDSKGKKLDLSYDTLIKIPIITKSERIFNIAIKKYPRNLALYEGPDNEELTQSAIDAGFTPTKEMLENNRHLRSNEYLYNFIIEQGMNDLLIYYEADDKNTIQKIYKRLLGDKYNTVITDDDTLKKYITAWISFKSPDMHKRLLSLLNKECVEAFATVDIDYYLVLKYSINNEKMDELVRIINQNKINDYCQFYKIVKEKYLTFDNNAFGVDMFLKLARFYNHYPELTKEIMTRDLDNATIANLISLINEKYKHGTVQTISELEQATKIQTDTIRQKMQELTTPEEIKDLILEYVFDMNYQEFMHILTNYINFDTLNKILAKASEQTNTELYDEAINLKILLQMIEETVNATDDFNSLKDLLEKFLNNPKEVNAVRSLYYNLKERIRNIYELDANATLTDIQKAKRYIRDKATPTEPDVIELEHQEFAIYAHVVSNPNLEEFVNTRFNGKVTISVSPISNIGKKLYGENGIVLGFTKIPRGGFVGSSNINMNSNGYIYENDYEPKKDKYYHLEFKDSSSMTPQHHPETLLYRDGLIPTCIIIREKNPSQEEIEAQKVLSDLGIDIPFVHTQAIGNVATLTEEEDVQIIEGEKETEAITTEEKINIGTYTPKLEKLRDLRKEIIKLKEKVDELNIKQDDIYDLIGLKIGGSHKMYKCHVKGKNGVYYLKPGVRKGGGAIDPYRSEAMVAAYRIQKIANPENAVYADIVQVPGNKIGVPNNNMVTCSIIKAMPDTTSYEGWYNSKDMTLSSQEVSSFIQECISDYLLFSYDTKGENFLKDKNGKTYGIDKEQALKFILHERFATQNQDTGEYTFDTSFAKHNSNESDFNNCGLLYVRLFEGISNGQIEITEENINAAIAAIDRVETISDEDYIQIFAGFINSFIESSTLHQKITFYTQKGYTEEEAKTRIKNDLCESLLARKQNLRKEFVTYFNQILDSYSVKRGVDVSEWKNKLNKQKQKI